MSHEILPRSRIYIESKEKKKSIHSYTFLGLGTVKIKYENIIYLAVFA